MTFEDGQLITGTHLKSLIGIKDDRTLARFKKSGMPFIKIGKLFRYDYQEVRNWLEENNKKSI